MYSFNFLDSLPVVLTFWLTRGGSKIITIYMEIRQMLGSCSLSTFNSAFDVNCLTIKYLPFGKVQFFVFGGRSRCVFTGDDLITLEV
jgi:hypothetical protein